MSDDPTTNAPTFNDELAEQLYDMLMREIEPDLLSYNIPKLDEYYKEETPEQHEARMKRYERAYQDFEYAFQKFMNEVEEEVRENKRSALKEKEHESLQKEQEKLASIEEAFS